MWEGNERKKAVVILTFTWSVGFRLAHCHRHLNLVHGRLERGEERGKVGKNKKQKTCLYSIFCEISNKIIKQTV